MIKARGKGTKDGKSVEFVILGLSYKNLRRLRAGEPISFEGDILGLPGFDFLILAGEDEQAMQREFAELVGPTTVVHDQR